jgi:hypothetical protein
MYTYLMLPVAVRAEVPALARERWERRELRSVHGGSALTSSTALWPGGLDAQRVR